MKKTFLGTISILIFVCAFTFPLAIPAASPKPQQNPRATAGASQTNSVQGGSSAKHSMEIQDSIESLRKARQYLNTSTQDFGGHRLAAVRAVDNAISQLQVCMQYDK